MNWLIRAAMGAVLLVACALAGAPARAQPDDARRKVFLEGTHAFRRILFTRRLQPLPSFRDLAENPEKTVVIILGATGPVRSLPGGLERFLRRGGAVLIATDRRVSDPRVRRELDRSAGVGVSQDTVSCPQASDCYQGLEYCPWVQPVKNAEPDLFRVSGTRTADWLRVATNVPSVLRTRPDGLRRGIHPLAYLPAGCHYDTPGRVRNWRTAVEDPLFAVGGDIGAGRLLVLADHSLFINQMMLRSDNGNIEFADNCVAWLRGEGGARDRVLFVEESEVRTDFNIPLRTITLPPGEVAKMLFARRDLLVEEANRLIANFEDQNDLSKLAFGALEEGGIRIKRLETGVLVAVTVLLLVYVGYRLGVRGRQQLEQAAPPLQAALARGVPSGPLIEQRRQAQLHAKNLWEPARELARRWMAAQGLSPDGPAPLVAAGGSWWQRWQSRRMVRRVWRLADGARPVRVSLAAFRRLQADLARLGMAVADGSVAIGAGNGERSVA